MRITKIYNNNVVSAVDDSGAEIVLAGAGVGFSRKPGQDVDPARIEKRFVLAPDDQTGLRQVLVEIPYDIITLVSRISRRLKDQHHIVLPTAVEIGLADHIHTSLNRMDQGIPLHNSMLWETRASYPDEFAIALEILDLVESGTGKRLPIDEAGFITMHLAGGAVMSGTGQAYQIAITLREIEAIVEADTGVAPDGGSAAYVRFLTHLKFVLQRLTERTQFIGNFTEMFTAQKAADQQGWVCARRIAALLEDRYQTVISDEETLYLMIHLARLRMKPTPAPVTPKEPDA
ncbi:MAG: PRD domain-containing protein [Propionicimonas sp.]